MLAILWVGSGVAGASEEESSMANVVGKRYVCTVCGSEFIVTKGGEGQLMCHGKPMQLKQ